MQLNVATDQAMLAAAYWQIAFSVLGIAVAIGGVVLALMGIRIARQTVRDQAANRAFPSDKAYSDEFVQRMRTITGSRFLQSEGSLGIVTSELRVACEEYTAHVTDAGLAIAGYFNQRQHQISDLANQRGHTPDDQFDDLELRIDAILVEIRTVGTDWVYPERRPLVRQRISGDRQEPVR